jgi:hypothetical protein
VKPLSSIEVLNSNLVLFKKVEETIN